MAWDIARRKSGFLKRDVDPFFMAGGSLANKNLRSLIEQGIPTPRTSSSTLHIQRTGVLSAPSEVLREGPAFSEYSDVTSEAVTGAQQAFMRRIEDIARQRRQPGRKQSIITK